MTTLPVWLQLGNLLLTLLGLPAFLVWKLTRIEGDIRRDITRTRDEVSEKIDLQYREFGETVAAIRQGLNTEIANLRKDLTDAEKFNRDTFMRRDSFYKAQEEIKSAISAALGSLEKRLERMETKIDSKT